MDNKQLKLNKGEITGVTITLTGLALGALSLLPSAKEGFWQIYSTGLIVSGLIAIGIGLLITILTVLKTRTSIFDIEKKIEAHTLVIIFAVVLASVIVTTKLVSKHLPHRPQNELSRMTPKAIQKLRQVESNFQTFFYLSVIIAGLSIVTIPTVKFFKN
ncbi:MAG: hypothetical protein KAI74_02670 [Kiritimatiellae bacterium]|nr:hypothetical protein [Kiritimatiellia bacterium]